MCIRIRIRNTNPDPQHCSEAGCDSFLFPSIQKKKFNVNPCCLTTGVYILRTRISYLPGGEPQQAAHGEEREVQHAGVGRLVRVSHLLLSLPHVGKVLDDALAQILQPLQLNLQRFQLGCVAQAWKRKRLNMCDFNTLHPRGLVSILLLDHIGIQTILFPDPRDLVTLLLLEPHGLVHFAAQTS